MDACRRKHYHKLGLSEFQNIAKLGFQLEGAAALGDLPIHIHFEFFIEHCVVDVPVIDMGIQKYEHLRVQNQEQIPEVNRVPVPLGNLKLGSFEQDEGPVLDLHHIDSVVLDQQQFV